MADSRPTIAVIGGTGDEGGALARRWVAAGYPVVIGSRSAERGQQKADELNAALSDREGVVQARGSANEAAAASGDIVVLTVGAAGASRPDVLEVGGLGHEAHVGPGVENVLAFVADRPGRFPIVTEDARRRLGVVVVRER